jgi:hypothetical protein
MSMCVCVGAIVFMWCSLMAIVSHKQHAWIVLQKVTIVIAYLYEKKVPSIEKRRKYTKIFVWNIKLYTFILCSFTVLKIGVIAVLRWGLNLLLLWQGWWYRKGKNYSLTYITTHVLFYWMWITASHLHSWSFFFLQEVRITTIEVVHCWTMLAVWENDKGASSWALPVEYGYHWCSRGYGMYVLPSCSFNAMGSNVSSLVQEACT